MRDKVGLPDPQGSTVVLTSKKNVPSSSPGVGLFAGREPAYAAFVFDGGLCEVSSQFSPSVQSCPLTRWRLVLRKGDGKNMYSSFL